MRNRFDYTAGSDVGRGIDDPTTTIIGRPTVGDTLRIPTDCAHPAAGTHQSIVAIDLVACPAHRDHAVLTYTLDTDPVVCAADCARGKQIYWYTVARPSTREEREQGTERAASPRTR